MAYGNDIMRQNTTVPNIGVPKSIMISATGKKMSMMFTPSKLTTAALKPRMGTDAVK